MRSILKDAQAVKWKPLLLPALSLKFVLRAQVFHGFLLFKVCLAVETKPIFYLQ